MTIRTRWSVLLVALARAWAFDPEDHARITEQKLKEILSQRESSLAIEEIVNANRCTDVGPEMFRALPDDPCVPGRYDSNQIGDAPAHFDNEQIAEGIKRLLEHRTEAIRSALSGKYVLARKHIGAATHSIQDFYAHTNWVELGAREPFQRSSGGLNAGVLGERTLRIAAPGDRVCAGEVRLLPEASDNGTLLTSGYFFQNGVDLASLGKCVHGLDLPTGAELSDGLNKDFPTGHAVVVSRGETYYALAHKLASAHTGAFLEGLIAEISPDSEALNGVFGTQR